MAPVDVLRAAQAAGVRLEARGERLAALSRGPLSGDLAALIRAHKRELLALLGADALTRWLAEPPPLHCEPPAASPTLPQLAALGEGLTAYLEIGEDALSAAPMDHARRAEALAHFEHLDRRLAALGALLAALRGQAYDRAALATWCAGEAFATGDLAAVLALVDAAGLAQTTEGQP